MPTIQDIFSSSGNEYLNTQHVSVGQAAVVRSIIQCRTSAMGGRMDICESCGETHVFYNSCGNRCCPTCQGLNKIQWVESRNADVLPVPYFHVVFTVPDELNPIFLHNQDVMYNLIFKAASETILDLAASKNFLDAQIGILSTLHTWGRNLNYHPHIHMLVPGGGLSNSGLKFVYSKKKFFLPVSVVYKVFRSKFLQRLKQLFAKGKLKFFGDAKAFEAPNMFDGLVDSLYRKKWVVYCKKPFKNTSVVMKYLAAYVYKTAISNHRIIAFENGMVTFKYMDYKDGKEKHLTLKAFEFIRRFLLHVLPKGFMRIRYFGILSNANRKRKLLKVKKLLGCKIYTPEKQSAFEAYKVLTGIDLSKCKKCGGKMLPLQTLMPIWSKAG